MFGSEILDVAIGMVFVYLLLSLICTAANEVIEAWLKRRATDLERGIRELLQDREGEAGGLTERLYKHPLVSGLFRGDYESSHLSHKLPLLKRVVDNVFGRVRGDQILNAGKTPSETGGRREVPREGRGEAIQKAVGTGAKSKEPGKKTGVYRLRGLLTNRGGTDLPSYIPSRNFALALLDLALNPETPGAGTPTPATPQPQSNPVSQLRGRLGNLSPEVERALRPLLDAAGDDLNKARENVERWYDSSMDRVSGLYKRRTQVVTLLLGLVLAVIINADTIAIFRSLSSSPSQRKVLVAAAAEYAKATPTAPSTSDASVPVNDCQQTPNSPECRVQRNMAQLEKFGLPIGWDCRHPDALPQCLSPTLEASTWVLPDFGLWRLKVVGWILTALALSLGAPFWFDLLNKFMIVRSTVKPREKSPDEKPVD